MPGFRKRFCASPAVDVVLPSVTRELMPLAKAKPAFVEKGIAVCVMDPEPLALANDKAALLSFCRDQGLPTPEFRVADTADEVERALDEMGCDRRALYVKAAQGNGSRGVRYVDPLVSRFDRFFNEKPDSAFMSKEDIMLALRESHIALFFVEKDYQQQTSLPTRKGTSCARRCAKVLWCAAASRSKARWWTSRPSQACVRR